MTSKLFVRLGAFFNSSSSSVDDMLPTLIEFTAMLKEFTSETLGEIVSTLFPCFNLEALHVLLLIIDVRPKEVELHRPVFSSTGHLLFNS